jgi:hypothetical protein
MRRRRVSYSLLGLMAVVAILALAMGMLKAEERERARRLLGQARLTAARDTYQDWLRLFELTRIEMDDVYRWSLRLREAQRELDDTRAGRAASSRDHQSRMVALRKILDARLGGGNCPSKGVYASLDYYIKESEYFIFIDQ